MEDTKEQGDMRSDLTSSKEINDVGSTHAHINSLTNDVEIYHQTNSDKMSGKEIDVSGQLPSSSELDAIVANSNLREGTELDGVGSINTLTSPSQQITRTKPYEEKNKNISKKYRVDPDLLIGYTRRNII